MNLRDIFTKRNLLTLGVIAAAVGLVALILVLTGRGQGKTEHFTGGLDTAYPYAWTENKNGTVLVEPSPAVPQGYGWTLTGSDPAVATVADKSTAERPAFQLTPKKAGDCFFELSLAALGDPEDVICRLVMTVQVSADRRGKATVTGSRLTPVEGILRGGEEQGAAYRLWTGEDGKLEVRLTDSEKAPDWRLTIGTTRTLGYNGLNNEDGALSLRLFGQKAGPVSFVLYSAARGLSLTVTGQTDAEGNVAAVTHLMEQHPEWTGKESGYADAAVVTEPVPAPEGAENVTYGRDTLKAGLGSVSRMDFTYLGCQWTLYVLPQGGVSTLLEKEYPEEQTQVFFVPAGLMQAVMDETAAVAWCDTETRGYLLEGSGEDIGPEVLLAVASEVMLPESE